MPLSKTENFANFTAYAPPVSVVVYPADSKVMLQWAEYAKATDYIIEYKASGDEKWKVYNEGKSITPGTTVLGLINGVEYIFRVSAVVNKAATEPSDVVAATPTVAFNANFYNQILSTGQSLALGAYGAPVLSTSQPFSNKMLDPKTNSLVELKETAIGANTGVESASSAMANMLSSLTYDKTINSIVTLNAVSGATYWELKKGTIPYKRGISKMKICRNISNSQKIPYLINAITTIHGEADEKKLTQSSTYATYLKNWQKDYETDGKLITGQDSSIPMFLCQMSSWTYYNHPTPETAIGQLQAAEENPSKIVLVTPKYIFDYNGQHLKNYSYRKLGEYYGKVMKKVIVDGEVWKPLNLESASISENIITAKFHVPVPPLQFDIKNVLHAKNYGFEYFDSSNSAYITDVAITDPTTVTITLNQVPTAEDMKLAYAFTGVSGAIPGRNKVNSVKGNLCDSDNTPTYYDYTPSRMENTLKNWCVTFIKPVISTESATLDIKKNDLNNSFSLYVNKTSNELNIEIPENFSGNKFMIYGLKGEEITNGMINSSKTIINISNLSSGVYFFKLFPEAGVEIKKFIVE